MITHSVVDKLWTEDVGQVEENLVLWVLLGRGGDIHVDSRDLLPFSCGAYVGQLYSTRSTGEGRHLRVRPHDGRLRSTISWG